MWYEKSFRRHLCDMHIADWNDEFMSLFDPCEYVKNLKLAKVSSAMIYLQSHVGLCYYPTRMGVMHKAFIGREDSMRRVIDMCHESGISATGYYSLIYNTAEHDRNPDWRLIYPDGYSQREGSATNASVAFSDANAGGRYGMCCPNNMEYRAFVKAQIEEMAEYFPDIDGMFYDMLFWPDLCYCDKCQQRWDREVGGELPRKKDWKDEKWLLHIHKRRVWMGEFAGWVTDVSKAAWKKEISVEHNVACSALNVSISGNAEEVLDACDYAGGDLYGTMFHQSFACKFYQSVTKNQPFEYMFSRCAPGLAKHTQIKSGDIMRSAMFLTAANHGATLIIDAIDPVGTLDERVYSHIGEVFGELIPYEPYMKGTPIADVGLYYSMKSRFDAYGDGYTNYRGVLLGGETMIAENVLWGVTGGFATLDKYKVILAPELTSEDAYDNERLIEYVRNGGVLYLSGGDCKSLLKELIGADIVGRTKENIVYVVPKEALCDVFGHYNEKYPLHFNAASPIVEGIDGESVLATLKLPYTARSESKFASIHSDPPGRATEYPAIIVKSYGKGKVIWSALPFECETLYDYREIFAALIKKLSGKSFVSDSDAPDDVEITAFETEGGVILHSVLLNTKKMARRVGKINVSLQLKGPAKEVIGIPDGAPIEFMTDGCSVSFAIDQNEIFKTYEIKLA